MEEQNSTAQTTEQSSNNDLHNSALSAVEELVYWRDVRRSALVFGGSLLVLISLATFSLISVLSYLLLAMLCVTITFRVYKSVIQAVQKSDEGHPFKVLLERNISITPETAHRYTDIILLNLNRALIQIRRLLLVEDVVDSLKLAGLMWVLTYVGAVFNGVTLLILADIVFFCTPLVYEKNKTQIDRYVELVRTQLEEKLEKLQEKLPGAVKRSKTD
ncbi:reticulon-3-B-like isoform X1 [Colossoma macropomum]|uniref:reticulon-3-B-like isoform X1 n=2 Tax=Colossoma macropomum TaxID=42526 RepID=UPI0018649C49|nr:reticulon-3-B-like isoform X1 [Colossoma macropomum]